MELVVAVSCSDKYTLSNYLRPSAQITALRQCELKVVQSSRKLLQALRFFFDGLVTNYYNSDWCHFEQTMWGRTYNAASLLC